MEVAIDLAVKVKLGTDTTKSTDVMIAGFRDLIGE